MKYLNRYIKISLLLVAFFFAAPNLQAQDAYFHSIGLRGGPIGGVSYKRFQFPPRGVLEGIVGVNFNERWGTITGLYEHHFFINYRLNWYGGGGVTFAFGRNDFDIVAETILGVEYTVETFPLNFSLDYKPGYQLFNGQFVFDEFALSIRYILD